MPPPIRKNPRTRSHQALLTQMEISNLVLTVGEKAHQSIDLTSGTLIEDWNPFSQRVVDSLQNPTSAKVWGSEFREISDRAYRTILLGHEAMHLFLLEPFFTGRAGLANQKIFVEKLLSMEAGCFFHADLIATRKIRETLPNGELIFARASASMVNFHPYQAFESIGVVDLHDILKIYVAAFLGRQPAVLNHPNIFTQGFQERMRSFYGPSKKSLGRLFVLLKNADLLTGLQDRFFAVKNLPTLMPAEAAKFFAARDPLSYIQWALGPGMNHLQKLPLANLGRVRTRRLLQTRAYFASSLRWILSSKATLPTQLSDRNTQVLITLVDQYLLGLEELLHQLAAGEDEFVILQRLQKNDRFYQSKIRKPLTAENLWIRERTWLVPERRAPGIYFQGPERISADPEIAQDVWLYLHTKVANLLQRQQFQAASAQSLQLQILGERIHLTGRAQKGQSWTRKVSKALETELQSKDFLPLWSVRLDSLHPSQSEFRELLFEYA